MNIDATRPAGSLEAFLNLIQVARVRNAGFEVPVARVNDTQTEQRTHAPRSLKAAGSLSSLREADPAGAFKSSEKPRQILGTRFDAYA